MPLTTRRPLLIALGAGLISATGFAPLEFWPLTLLGVAVLLWLVHEAPRLRDALLRGWVWGLGYFTLGDNWIQHAFTYQDKMPQWLGYLAVVLVALYLAVYPALAMGLAWRFAQLSRTKRPRIDTPYVLAAAAAWIVSEWLRADLFTGYPWNPLGVTWLPLPPVVGIARLIGTYALSGVTVAVAGLLLIAAMRRAAPLAIGAVVLVVAALLAPSTPVAVPADRPLVRVVQPNIGQDGVSDPRYPETVLRRLIALSGKPGPKRRLVVWPEGMVMQWLEDGYPAPLYAESGDAAFTRARIAQVLGPKDMALVGGESLSFTPDRLHVAGAGNSVWAVRPDATLGQRYDKAHLVPYGEYLPMRPLLEPLGLARLVMGDIDFIPGPGPRAIDVPGFGKAGVQICYEIIFSGQVVDRAHRPDFIFNPSNDAWFGSWGPPEHLAQARMRAIEEGLPILRATPTGISAVIDADGRLLGTVPHGQAGAVEVPLPMAHAPTLFARLGNLLAFVTAGLLLALAVALQRGTR